ncbi:MAG: HD domain-containing protein [Thermodesulfobacteriota bacterium]
MLEGARSIIDMLHEKGFESFLVGGCVRDLLMKRVQSDVDIATGARPEEVMEIFSGEEFFSVPTGLAHGTVTVVLGGINFEVTTFRRELSTDGRRATVEFGTSMEEDLARRDFTINAIAFCPRTGRYIDPFGGREDIGKKLIRAVGVPLERFREDYLRIFRAHRFEAALEFAIDGPTREAIKSAASEEWERVVSPERIREEITRCFKQAEAPSIMLEGMRESGMLERLFPELMRCPGFEQNRHHEYDLYCHTLLTVDATPRTRPLVRWAALFHDLGKVDACENYGPGATFYGHERISEELARGIMSRLRFGNSDKARVLNLVRHHLFHYTDDMKGPALRRLVASVGEENVEELCILKHADRIAKSSGPAPDYEEGAGAILKRLERMAAEEKLFKIKDLAISGKDVMEIKGMGPSREVGEILKALYETVLEDPAKNTKEKLKKMVEEMVRDGA